MTKGLFQEIGKRFLKLDVVRDLTMEIFENGENYLTLSELHIALKIYLQEEISGETIIKSQHDTFLKVCQAFCKSSVVHMMMKMWIKWRKKWILEASNVVRLVWSQKDKMVGSKVLHHLIQAISRFQWKQFQSFAWSIHGLPVIVHRKTYTGGCNPGEKKTPQKRIESKIRWASFSTKSRN